jgi:protein involved in polysaccharide export with SLBB domain
VVSSGIIEFLVANSAMIQREDMMARSVIIRFSKTLLVLASAGALIMAVSAGIASAQEVDQELLKRLQQERNIRPDKRQSPLDTAREGTQEPTKTTKPRELESEIEPAPKPSALESDYQERLGQVPELKKRAIVTENGDIVTIEEEEFEGIEQYGYDMFGRPEFPAVNAVNGVGSVGDNYVLGIGDQIVVTMVGAKSDAFIFPIDREGRFVMPELLPIPAAGLTLGDFKRVVEKAASETMVGTDIFISVGSVRQINVYVMGEVNIPGSYNLTAMASVFDALNAAAGIRKSGSLRNIVLVQNGTTTNIDLYDFILGASSAEIRISDGARISVPSIGQNAAVAGSVIRSAIYEFPPSGAAPTFKQMLDLAGGMLRARGNRIVLNRIEDSGQMIVSEIEDTSDQLWDGDILEVIPKSNYQAGKVSLLGHVSVEGTRSLGSNATVSSLIKSRADLGSTPYLNFAILVTTDPDNFSRVLRPVDLNSILDGGPDIALRENDKLYVFSAENIRYLSSAVVRNAVIGGDVGQVRCSALEYLVAKVNQVEGRRFDVLRRAFFSRGPIIEESASREAECPEVFQSNPEYLVFALEHSLAILGGVHFPGVYPVAEKVSLGSLIASAGGLLPDADLNGIEITQPRTGAGSGIVTAGRILVNLNGRQPSQSLVQQGSSVRVHLLSPLQEPGSVLLTGEFKRPGIFAIQKGETFLELIGRAGGLTEQAFPYGAVMTRLSVKREQEEGFRRTAREINAALASAAVKSDLSAEAAIAVRELATELATIEAPGRLVVEADPAALRARPELNVLLEAGDRIHMPKRPQFVIVTGDVLNPGALQFIAGKDVKQFLKEAGGLTKTADDDRVFLIYPNGVATPVKTALWSFKSHAVPPGSTIVVPKDLSTFTTLEIIRSVTGIFSQLALAAASLAVVADRR